MLRRLSKQNIRFMQLDKNMENLWNDFCLNSDTAWFRHTTWFLEYALNCRFDKKSKNLAFMVYQDNIPVAAVPLIMQTISDEPEILEFALGDTNIPFPAFTGTLSSDNRKNFTKIIFGEIDRLAEENGVSYARFFFDPLCVEILSGNQVYNSILKFGYHETSLSTNIISLDISETEIFSNIRKGHKADIKTAIKNCYTLDFFAQENISQEAFNIYKNLHLTAAGRKTRPDESWDLMFEFIKDGFSVLVLERVNGEYVAGALVFTYKNAAYYGSGATHPDFERVKGIGHLLQWEIIRYLKKRGYRYYETGWNFYPVLSQEVVSDKELNIAFFKSGFGGEIYPLFRGEKFYNKEYFKRKKWTLIEKYCNTFFR